MAYSPDPGGQFPSDAHRRVLGHLSLPTDLFGWNLAALAERLKTDGIGFVDDVEGELTKILEELKDAGHAIEHAGGIFQQTEQGADALVAPVPAELQSKSVRPAVISAATPIGAPVPEAPGPDGPVQPAMIEAPVAVEAPPAAEATPSV